MTNEDEGFLARWSRRKAEAKSEDEATPSRLPAEPDPAALAPLPAGAPGSAPDIHRDDPPDEETRAAWVARLESIDIAKLDYEDDFKVFMKGWVPEALRSRALKRLWETSDLFRLPDGFNEYADDYTMAPVTGGAVRTGWKPGRGFASADDDGADGDTARPTAEAEDAEETAEAASTADRRVETDPAAEPSPEEAVAADEAGRSSAADKSEG